MKKLRLTPSEWEEMLKSISAKFHKDCHMNVTDFEYTKKDVTDFLNNNIADNVKKPTIWIDSEAYTKMYELVKQSPLKQYLIDQKVGL